MYIYSETLTEWSKENKMHNIIPPLQEVSIILTSSAQI